MITEYHGERDIFRSENVRKLLNSICEDYLQRFIINTRIQVLLFKSPFFRRSNSVVFNALKMEHDAPIMIVIFVAVVMTQKPSRVCALFVAK